MDQFGKTLGMQLRGAYLSLHRRFNLYLKGAFGVTADQFVVLTLLEEEEGITQQEVTARCYSDPSTVGAILRLLEKKKLITRKPHPADGRAWSIRLTARGRSVQRRLWEDTREFHGRLWGAIRTAQEEEIVTRVLDRIIEEMHQLDPDDVRGSMRIHARVK